MELFALISLWDIFLIVVFLGLGIYSSVQENIFVVVISILAIFAASLIAGYNPVMWIYENPIQATGIFLGYFFVGGLYAMFVTWPRWLTRRADSIRERQVVWRKTAKDEDFFDSYEYERFTAAKNKDTIVAMICTWMWDAVWRVIRNPVVWSYEGVYKIFAHGFEQAGRRTAEKVLRNNDKS